MHIKKLYLCLQHEKDISTGCVSSILIHGSDIYERHCCRRVKKRTCSGYLLLPLLSMYRSQTAKAVCITIIKISYFTVDWSKIKIL